MGVRRRVRGRAHGRARVGARAGNVLRRTCGGAGQGAHAGTRGRVCGPAVASQLSLEDSQTCLNEN